MKKIAIVNQRYGLEVNGGSEYYTRLIAEHLKEDYSIEVLTTTALRYDTWANDYPAGTSQINGVTVRRFPVQRKRNMLYFRIVGKVTRMLARLGVSLDRWWVRAQGPYTPDLIRYIREQKDAYDRFLFVTYLYYTTAMGLPEAAEKAVLIPTAHDEPYIHRPIYRGIFQKPSAILFLTEEEREFVQRKFHNAQIPNDVAGVGIDIPAEFLDPAFREEKVRVFREAYRITGDYLIYAGRVDYGKSCDEMFRLFEQYKSRHPKDAVCLVVIGKDMMGIPERPDIHYLGFVPEEDKYAGIAGAKCLWLPSRFESLSIALLEGMALGIPGLVNGNCEVLKGHCKKSGAAFYYRNREEFERCMRLLHGMDADAYGRMQTKAVRYVEQNYQWDAVRQKLRKLIG